MKEEQNVCRRQQRGGLGRRRPPHAKNGETTAHWSYQDATDPQMMPYSIINSRRFSLEGAFSLNKSETESNGEDGSFPLLGRYANNNANLRLYLCLSPFRHAVPDALYFWQAIWQDMMIICPKPSMLDINKVAAVYGLDIPKFYPT